MKLSCLALATLALVTLGACRPVHDGPVVLITIDALRADVVGALGGDPRLTPHLDRFASRADWAGRAVAPSSWTVPSMASLMTGLRPWSTGSWSADYAGLDPKRTTLAEAFQAHGYTTTGFSTNTWLRPQFGYGQGFDRYSRLVRPRQATVFLETLTGGRDFVWVHVLPPHAPYLRHKRFADRIDVPLDSLPTSATALDLEQYFDPAVPLPPAQERELRALYALHTAHADEIVGRLLDALEHSGQFERSLVVITADHGEEFGEHGQIGHGGSLGRVLLEVPLLIKLPADWPRALAIEPGQRPGTVRVAATLLETVGAERPPGAAKSLWQTPRRGVFSELYQTNGVNQFSLVEGDTQLIWESRFEDSSPVYYGSRRDGIAGRDAEAVQRFFADLRASFATTQPLTGRPGSVPRLELRTWKGGRSEILDDPSTLRARTRQLRDRWLEHHGPEHLPGATKRGPALDAEALEELRALGYVGG